MVKKGRVKGTDRGSSAGGFRGKQRVSSSPCFLFLGRAAGAALHATFRDEAILGYEKLVFQPTKSLDEQTFCQSDRCQGPWARAADPATTPAARRRTVGAGWGRCLGGNRDPFSATTRGS